MNTIPKGQICSQCGSKEKLEVLYGYPFCQPCKIKLGLFTDNTIKRHFKTYLESNKSYEADIKHRLEFIEHDFIKKKVKLLHILDRLNDVGD